MTPTEKRLRERAENVLHYVDRECPHCHEIYECGVCRGTVNDVAQALLEERNRALEEAKQEALKIGLQSEGASKRAMQAGRYNVASHRSSDAETSERIALAIAALKSGGAE